MVLLIRKLPQPKVLLLSWNQNSLKPRKQRKKPTQSLLLRKLPLKRLLLDRKRREKDFQQQIEMSCNC